MNKTILIHYLSQCISKGFVTSNNTTFWQCDCSKDYLPAKRGLRRLFAKKHAWGQELEDKIATEFENEVAPILKKYNKYPIKRVRKVIKNRAYEVQFNGVYIAKKKERAILSKLLLQTALLQGSVSINNDQENVLKAFFETNVMSESPIFVFEINPLMTCDPLILVDCMLFSFFVPSNPFGHICFAFPISIDRILIWGNPYDLQYFARKYQDINYFNLCRIEQNSKECLIASQNKEYISKLSLQIPDFHSDSSDVSISLARHINDE